MEFWGAEVKPWTPLTVTPEEDSLIHISQATLDCKEKMGEPVVLTVTVDKQKLVIGTLSQEKFPQISFNLFFEKEFKISHNCTKGSVHFIGSKSPNFEEVEEEEEVPVNGNAGAAALHIVKGDSKPKAKPAEVKPESDDDDDNSDEEDDSDDDDDSEKGMDVDEDDSDNDDSSSEEEETPKKPEQINKKRPNKSASEKPVSEKKAKPAAAPPATPQRTEKKKKGGHTSIAHGPQGTLDEERAYIITCYTSGSRASARRMIRDGWTRASKYNHVDFRSSRTSLKCP